VDELGPADMLRTRLRRHLSDALKARRNEEAAAVRCLMAAIDDAEAAGVRPAARPAASTGQHFAGSVAGVASGDVPRRELVEADLAAIIDREIADRTASADRYEALGRPEDATRLRDQARLLSRYKPASGRG
jgi:hypothetical protein